MIKCWEFSSMQKLTGSLFIDKVKMYSVDRKGLKDLNTSPYRGALKYVLCLSERSTMECIVVFY